MCGLCEMKTEWTETVDLGFNIITGADTTNIIDAVSEFNNQGSLSIDSSPYGDGNSAEKNINSHFGVS